MSVAPTRQVLAFFETTLSWKEVLVRTYREVVQDDAQALAAELSYYFFLSLFPALLALIALASFFPLQNFTGDVMQMLAPIAPRELIGVIQEQMMKIGEQKHGGLLSVGFLMAIWSSSGAMVAVVSAMNRAYDIDESRPWWKVRITSILLTIALAIFILISFTLIVAGPEIADFLGRHIGFSWAFVWGWKILQWPLSFFLVSTAFGLVYYYAPDAEQQWVWITPGALAATMLWFIASLVFRFYATNFGSYEETYGTIGGIILLLLWFWITGLVIVIGAEMNAEIEHASPWGKAPGEKVPGQKKRIGAAAAWHFHHHKQTSPSSDRHAPDTAPQSVPVFRPALPPVPASPSFIEKAAVWAAVVVRWRRRHRAA